MPAGQPGSSGRRFPLVGHEELPLRLRAEGAFLPDPLPAEVTLRSSTWRDLADAQEALGRLDQATVRSPNLDDLVRFTQYRDVLAAAELDGVSVLTREVVMTDLPGFMTPSVDERLRHYLAADEEGVAAIRNGHPLDVDLLARLSGILTGSAAGAGVRWRDGPGWLGPSPEDAYLITAPPGVEMQVATEQWCSWVDAQKEIPLVAKLALGYFQFVVLSPFPHSDHLARLFFNLELIRSRVLRHPVLPISAWLIGRDSQYRQLMRVFVDGGELDEPMSFVAGGIQIACEQQIQLIEELRLAHESMLRAVVRRPAIERLVASLIAHPVINHLKIAEVCDVSLGYATRLARRLQDAGLARNLDPKTLEHDPKDKTYGKVIYCPQIVRLFQRHQPLSHSADRIVHRP